MNCPNQDEVKAIVFDVGGVLLRTADYRPRQQWDERLGLPPNTVEETVFNSDLGTAAQRGLVTINAHWRNIQTHFDLTDEQREQLRQDFWAGDRFDWQFIEWIRTLKPRYRLGIISNAFDDLRQVLYDEFGVGDLFDVITVSAEEHLMKPAPEIYQRTVWRLNVAPAEALFIDDSLVNVRGAQAVGMQAIHFQYRINPDLPGLVGRKL